MDGEHVHSLTNDLVATIPSLMAFAISLCGNRTTADDLVQETLVKAWSKLNTFEEGTNLKAWLFTILRNTYFSQWRRQRNEVVCSNGSFGSVPTRAEQPGHMDMQDFREALQKLPAERREALVLVGAAGFSYEEAARITGCEPGTVKSRVSRARAQLAELLHSTPLSAEDA